VGRKINKVEILKKQYEIDILQSLPNTALLLLTEILCFRMLGQLELKMVRLLYSILSSKVVLIPLFSWKDLRLSVRSNRREIGNWILNCIIILELYFSVKQLSTLIKKRDINAAILQIIFTARFFAYFILRLNMLFYKYEVARVINQTSDINKGWGNYKVPSFYLSYFTYFAALRWQNVFLPPYQKRNFIGR